MKNWQQKGTNLAQDLRIYIYIYIWMKGQHFMKPLAKTYSNTDSNAERPLTPMHNMPILYRYGMIASA